ncbi:hypothetical protein [Burkholderia ubonensis]|uniref:hypothetical protein n=1 Tax=Burkholderia ubonensis TaxID=101571 RepID=UPI000F59D843|nr:hypothetical protein [Burkholderia ubonensis]
MLHFPLVDTEPPGSALPHRGPIRSIRTRRQSRRHPAAAARRLLQLPAPNRALRFPSAIEPIVEKPQCSLKQIRNGHVAGAARVRPHFLPADDQPPPRTSPPDGRIPAMRDAQTGIAGLPSFMNFSSQISTQNKKQNQQKKDN